MELNIAKNENYKLTDTDVLMVSEDYMEEILAKEGLDIDSGCGEIDSTAVVDEAIELGFMNLGDFGKGFIFVTYAYELSDDILKYFPDINKWW